MKALWAAALLVCDGLVRPGVAFQPGGSSSVRSSFSSSVRTKRTRRNRVHAQCASIVDPGRRNRVLPLKMVEGLHPSPVSERESIISMSVAALIVGLSIGGLGVCTVLQMANLNHKVDDLTCIVKTVSSDINTVKLQLNMILAIGQMPHHTVTTALNSSVGAGGHGPLGEHGSQDVENCHTTQRLAAVERFNAKEHNTRMLHIKSHAHSPAMAVLRTEAQRAWLLTLPCSSAKELPSSSAFADHDSNSARDTLHDDLEQSKCTMEHSTGRQVAITWSAERGGQWQQLWHMADEAFDSHVASFGNSASSSETVSESAHRQRARQRESSDCNHNSCERSGQRNHSASRHSSNRNCENSDSTGALPEGSTARHIEWRCQLHVGSDRHDLESQRVP
ncbi:hypothetical protein JKP88DRAFT_265211 [Tribonema minus]|uniref:Transmembrane protein n=1 Tax=Tribonema minus TaxID=303371 RepID=A0A836CA47_9STRA|nr:hypothetical protein JKP88DRAFT_265211 [Tribonema minus]